MHDDKEEEQLGKEKKEKTKVYNEKVEKDEKRTL